MINRILIRIKVVQILYSYLLSRNEFKVDLPPENASRDRRFGYAVYLDALNLIQELSGIRTNHPDRALPAIDVNPKLRANRVGRALADNVQLREITFKHPGNLNLFGPLLQKLSDEIVAQNVFADYKSKRDHSLEEDVKLWTVLIETVFLKNPEVMAVLRSTTDFSLTGLHYGLMQAVATLNAYNDLRSAYAKAKKELMASLDKSYELYLALFVLMIELTAEEADRQQMAKEKHLASAADLNPNTRFVDNEFVKMLSGRKEIADFVKSSGFTWLDVPGLLKELLDEITRSEIYEKYMASPKGSWKSDCEFWRDVMRSIVLPSLTLDAAIEAKSIYWNDDLPTIGTFVLKTIRRFAAVEGGDGVEFLPQFKDEEDAEFGEKLFVCTVENREKYKEYIDRFISSDWDPERLAFMDIVIMTTAIAEVLNFPAIPIPVTLNEYIEIANTYSTHRSGPFINGILYSVISYLAEEGILRKPFTRLNSK